MFIMKVVHNNEIELVRDLQELRELLKKKKYNYRSLMESKERQFSLSKRLLCE